MVELQRPSCVVSGKLHGLQTAWCFRHLQVRHGASGEQPARRLGQPAGDSSRACFAGAVGGDAGIGIHLAIDLRDQDEGHAAFPGMHEAGPLPDRADAVEAVPHSLRSLANLVSRHRRVQAEVLGAGVLWNEPAARERYAVHVGRLHVDRLFPLCEVHCSGKGR